MANLPDLIELSSEDGHRVILFGPIEYAGYVQSIDYFATRHYKQDEKIGGYKVIGDIVPGFFFPALVSQIESKPQDIYVVQLLKE
ncbi:MAG: hypothetical protein ACRDBG_27430 [Waterburya sp.]